MSTVSLSFPSGRQSTADSSFSAGHQPFDDVPGCPPFALRTFSPTAGVKDKASISVARSGWTLLLQCRSYMTVQSEGDNHSLVLQETVKTARISRDSTVVQSNWTDPYIVDPSNSTGYYEQQDPTPRLQTALVEAWDAVHNNRPESDIQQRTDYVASLLDTGDLPSFVTLRRPTW
ncbi:hypothetical protein BCR39DRAFT_540424 [Naematelia encephala]|uniref:Uncharacterized protein n=1 Tax=Naematelia encephala TaxID=71784 RepID=A0A1Y2AVX3_9TREE|nr:hypothetical protein BCR39DRAFT_540424 [Naematelia encephala]